jgi:HAE1 family hydrophobic/amphiphilic exporter-1
MNLLRDRGYNIRDAAVEAGGNRLRPVLMTSLTTILGMVPLAFGSGEGAELVRPIGQTIVGGMIMSTLMTLFLVPMLYARMNRKHDAGAHPAGSRDSALPGSEKKGELV